MKVAMLGHKAIPSTKGGIETVLTALCPLLADRGAEVTCYNRSADRIDAAFCRRSSEMSIRACGLKKRRLSKTRHIGDAGILHGSARLRVIPL